MTKERFYMDESGDLYDKENNIVMVDFGYSYDGVGCKRIIDLLNKLHEENKELKEQLKNCTKKAKEEIRKQAEDDAIRWINIGR